MQEENDFTWDREESILFWVCGKRTEGLKERRNLAKDLYDEGLPTSHPWWWRQLFLSYPNCFIFIADVNGYVFHKVNQGFNKHLLKETIPSKGSSLALTKSSGELQVSMLCDWLVVMGLSDLFCNALSWCGVMWCHNGHMLRHPPLPSHRWV